MLNTKGLLVLDMPVTDISVTDTSAVGTPLSVSCIGKTPPSKGDEKIPTGKELVAMITKRHMASKALERAKAVFLTLLKNESILIAFSFLI